MSDIFISYAREDRRKAEMLSTLFEQRGWSVWWDRDIPIGRLFHDVIQRELRAAKCVVVLWSSNSVKSNFVLDEATDASERGVMLPALIEDIKAPLGFGRFQTVNLARWNGKELNVDITHLFAAVADLVKSQESETNPSAQDLDDGRLTGRNERLRGVSDGLYAHWKLSLIAIILAGCGLIWIVVRVVRPVESSNSVNSNQASAAVEVPTNSNDSPPLTNANSRSTVNAPASKNSNSESTNRNVEPSPSINPTTADSTTVNPSAPTKERIISLVNYAVKNGLDQRGEINPNARLKEDLGADDLDIVEITMHLEKLFHIPLNDDDLKKVKRVQDFYSLIEEKTSKGR